MNEVTGFKTKNRAHIAGGEGENARRSSVYGIVQWVSRPNTPTRRGIKGTEFSKIKNSLQIKLGTGTDRSQQNGGSEYIFLMRLIGDRSRDRDRPIQ